MKAQAERVREQRAIPASTYRLQLNAQFGFAAAAAIAPYLARLGVSHVYTSPILKARSGSVHGYDITAHDALNPELGDDAAFRSMVVAFRAARLRIVLDFVPNHMGVGGADNPLWLDVLEWGAESPHAGWFDIDWEPYRGYLHEKLLVPVLGDQYGVELDAGRLVLAFDEQAGEFAVWAYDSHKLPIYPLTYADVLGDEHAVLERFGDQFGALHDWRPQVARRAAELKRMLAEAVRADVSVREALARAVERLNRPDGEDSRRELDALIRKQHWRAAHFRVAGDDINYRRFFNINDLAGVRVELPEVFEHVHKLVLGLVADGSIEGLRIDHIDGLHEPRDYLRRLRDALEQVGKPSCYVIVEKILGVGEALPETWPIEGTTGYEFANIVLRALVDPAGEPALSRLYRKLTDERAPFDSVLYDAKMKIMRNEMASEVNVLARDAARIARQNPRTADFTHDLLRTALRELIACFPVYRTYVDAEGNCTDVDLAYLGEALASARSAAPQLDTSVFAFLARLLSGKLVEGPRSGFSRVAVLKFAMKFQQLSGPVMAKGLEDTAFYRYCRFIALNEVGGDPRQFGSTLDEFHAAMAERARRWPHGLSATSTHDTKRGEDARARLAVLAELADDWAREVEEWRALLRGAETQADPEPNDEYYLFQSLIGVWPAEFCVGDAIAADDLEDLAERVKGGITKALREAKRRTSWMSPDERYESAALELVDRALAPGGDNPFLARFLPFVRRVAALGVCNSLAQVTLKMTAPGVPDVYQGSDLWDFSLVDPDNRRPVDFARRAALLESVQHALAADRCAALRRLFEGWHDGGIKLVVTQLLLDLRRSRAELFAHGDYVPCEVRGPRSDEIVAFARRHRGEKLLTVVHRFPGRAARANGGWQSTRVIVPGVRGIGSDQLTGHDVEIEEAIAPAALFATLPVAVVTLPRVSRVTGKSASQVLQTAPGS